MVSGSAKSNESVSKVVLITGASKGIGEGCARVFCGAGKRVVICARGKEAGQSLALDNPNWAAEAARQLQDR